MTILFAGKIADIIGEIDSFSDKYYSVDEIDSELKREQSTPS
jgi:hypothetical protein